MLDVAEELFGLPGLTSVSMREIAVAAGQRNNSAVRYHFGDKERLVDELVDDRAAKIEARRQELIDRTGDLSSCSADDLLKILFKPYLDFGEERGNHYYIRFLLFYHIQTAGARHPGIADPSKYTASSAILTALHDRFGHLSEQQFRYRMVLVTMMFRSAVSMHDQAAIATNQIWSTKFSLDETVKLATAALAAPA
jgi:AcrR family transcriptional regulator